MSIPTQIPSPPPRNPRLRRYPMTLVTLARRMYGDGDAWTPSQIRNYLRTEHGADVALQTVRCWVVPGAAEEQRRQNLASYHRRKGARRAGPPSLETAFERLARLRALRDAGLSFANVAVVFAVDTGLELSAEEVRYVLQLRPRKRLSKILTNKLMGVAA